MGQSISSIPFNSVYYRNYISKNEFEDEYHNIINIMVNANLTDEHIDIISSNLVIERFPASKIIRFYDGTIHIDTECIRENNDNDDKKYMVLIQVKPNNFKNIKNNEHEHENENENNDDVIDGEGECEGEGEGKGEGEEEGEEEKIEYRVIVEEKEKKKKGWW